MNTRHSMVYKSILGTQGIQWCINVSYETQGIQWCINVSYEHEHKAFNGV